MKNIVNMPDAETCWQALTDKDTRFNGLFYFAVRTTGVYCKPSCAARRPRRENVLFFPSGDAAAAAGFRPCRRCRPHDSDPQAKMVERACRIIEANPDRKLSLAELSAQLGVSAFHLQRTFKKIAGVSPRQYALARNVQQFKKSINEGESVINAMYDAGYGSSSRLYEQANAELGMTPATYRRRGNGMAITYTTAQCNLGRLLVATTERGLCAVRLGDSDEELEAALRAEFNSAEIVKDDDALSQSVAAILNYLEGKQQALELPLDVQATTFQRRVWEALRRIPYGATRSYKEIAAAIGAPRAVRAVARACAANPLALVTPCHRVIATDGRLGGYRWGMERKQRLLARERKR